MTDVPVALPDPVQEIARSVRDRFRGMVQELRIEPEGESVVLYGRAYSYYGKQMAQEAVIRSGRFSVRANRMDVIG
ncbi:MAG TPA: hypothetical protein VGJ05_22700 [Fimbriiglobus sp.]|jgi:hypothetical protein